MFVCILGQAKTYSCSAAKITITRLVELQSMMLSSNNKWILSAVGVFKDLLIQIFLK